MPEVLGLDIGGANLKAAHSDRRALVRPFPLWRSPELLTARLEQLIADMPGHDLLAVTMTGELCDCFESKSAGVLAILASVAEVARTPVAVWTLGGRFVEFGDARRGPLGVAAANWLALGHLVSRFARADAALMIDTGSTTTDILYLHRGVPAPRGHSDRQRLDAGELVYTGVRRTPVCAVLGMEVAAEFFATMLDVYIVLGHLSEREDDTDTADGRTATRAHAYARLARLRCAHVGEMTTGEIEDLARRALSTQTRYLGQALRRVLRDRPVPRTVIISGSGERLGQIICGEHPELVKAELVSLSTELGPHLSEAAAAYAVAVLAQEQCR